MGDAKAVQHHHAQYDAHRQPDAQGQDLDENIVFCFHLYWEYYEILVIL